MTGPGIFPRVSGGPFFAGAPGDWRNSLEAYVSHVGVGFGVGEHPIEAVLCHIDETGTMCVLL